ncbi:hypothetical protein [Micromonospora echinofusca]|uniref:hypothetical protein n=1 Tax=Micromonospora echinofusca TaxID=47858 RepID=UPI001FCCDECB|nr:hypothetical protein [Micromonospora echinofusca]
MSYEQFLSAVALTLARRHRPVWSWPAWRWVCRCGAELPCRYRHRVPIGRQHWPTEAEHPADADPTAEAEHPADADPTAEADRPVEADWPTDAERPTETEGEVVDG